MVLLMLICYLNFKLLEFRRIQQRVAKSVAEHGNGLRSIAFENMHAKAGVLSIRMSCPGGTNVIQISMEISLRHRTSTSCKHLLKKIRGTSRLKRLISGACTDIHANTKTQKVHLMS